MDMLWSWTFFSVFCWTSSLQLPNIRLTNSCPSSYTIQASKGSVLRMEVMEKENACDRIPKLSKRKDVQIVNDLSPSMTVGTVGDRNVVNISWTATVIDIKKNGSGNKLPRMILLELKKYVKVKGEIEQSKDCVLFRLKKRKLKEDEAPPTLFFDCIELVKDIEVYLGVQVRCLPNSASAIKSCQTRHKRSIPMSRPCQTIYGKVICSEDKLFPLSLDSHIAGICHCSARPKPGLSKLDNGSFQLDAWNLPQYAYEVQFEIYRGLEIVYSKTMDQTTKPNERRSTTTERKFGPGNYTLVVTAKCYGGKEDIRASGRNCPTMDSVQIDYPLEVPYPQTTQPYEFRLAEHTILPIGAAVILSTLVTLTVFCIRKRRTKPPVNRDIMIELEPLSPRNNAFGGDESPLLAHASLKPEKMLIYHPDDKFHIKCIAVLQELCKELDVSLEADETSNNEVNAYIDENIAPSMSSEIDRNGDSVKLHANWRDFAERAGTEYTEIVIIMSRGLYEICEAYRDRSTEKEALNALRRERQYEIIPCIVLQKLQTIIQENPDTESFSVHIISFETDRTLIEEFLSTFDFLKRCRYCYTYCLTDTFNYQTNRGNSGRLNVSDLKLLLRRLRGMSEYEEGNSAIDTVLSNQTFGSDLSSALHEKMHVSQGIGSSYV